MNLKKKFKFSNINIIQKISFCLFYFVSSTLHDVSLRQFSAWLKSNITFCSHSCISNIQCSGNPSKIRHQLHHSFGLAYSKVRFYRQQATKTAWNAICDFQGAVPFSSRSAPFLSTERLIPNYVLPLPYFFASFFRLPFPSWLDDYIRSATSGRSISTVVTRRLGARRKWIFVW